MGLAVMLAPVVALSPVAGDHEYVWAPPATRGSAAPEHAVCADGDTVTLIEGLTVTVTLAVFVQPEALIPVTVYAVVVVGFAITTAPVAALSPVAGDHEYDVPPPAVSCTAPPLQILSEVAGVMVMVGFGFTVTVIFAVLEQPTTEVPVTV